MTERYLVFGGATYYPSGGWSDLVGRYDTIEDAAKGLTEEVQRAWIDWAHIVDLEDDTLAHVSAWEEVDGHPAATADKLRALLQDAKPDNSDFE